MTLEKVLGVGAVRNWLHLVTKPSHVGVDVDGPSYPLHHPTTYGCHLGVHSSRFETVLLYLVTKPF
jgi:hypothetical protein